MSVDTKDLLPLAIARADSINTYWNLYIGVATGTLGLMASNKTFSSSAAIKTALIVGFSVFAASNLLAILSLNQQRTELIKLISDCSLKDLMEALKPYDTSAYVIYHLALDLVVIGAILLVGRLYRNIGNSNDGGI